MGKIISTSEDFIKKRMLENKETIRKVPQEVTDAYNESCRATRELYRRLNAASIQSASQVYLPGARYPIR
jgi:hypothetical protein